MPLKILHQLMSLPLAFTHPSKKHALLEFKSVESTNIDRMIQLIILAIDESATMVFFLRHCLWPPEPYDIIWHGNCQEIVFTFSFVMPRTCCLFVACVEQGIRIYGSHRPWTYILMRLSAGWGRISYLLFQSIISLDMFCCYTLFWSPLGKECSILLTDKKYPQARGYTGEFSCARAKNVLVPRTQEKQSKKTSRITIRATPKIGNFHFRQWWPISTCGRYFAMLTSCPPGFRDVVAQEDCMRVPLRR